MSRPGSANRIALTESIGRERCHGVRLAILKRRPAKCSAGNAARHVRAAPVSRTRRAGLRPVLGTRPGDSSVHPTIFAEFDRICRARGAGGDVLEIGSTASDDTLLCLPALCHAQSRIGVNLDGPFAHAGFEVLRADANDMACFPDGAFDTVLCNSVLEHDRRFWLTLAEIRRVARPGALVVIGVPGFASGTFDRGLARALRVPGFRAALRRSLPSLLASTPTLLVHEFPADYYRFSPQAARDVFLEGLAEPEVHTVLVPPRVLAVGVKPVD